MSTPKVSIIIPTYNRAHLIGLTLQSVHRQTYTDYEIVVVDDGSLTTRRRSLPASRPTRATSARRMRAFRACSTAA